MERVAFLLHGTFEGKKTIGIFVRGKAALSEEEGGSRPAGGGFQRAALSQPSQDSAVTTGT